MSTIGSTQILNLPAPPTDQEKSPTYSISGQSNTARLGAVIPIHYGRHILWPDPIMTPYREFDGADEWYYFLGCAGVGKISTEQWRFGDVYLDQLPIADRQYQTLYPGQVPSIVPATVYTGALGSVELTAVQSTGVAINPAATTVTQLAADVELAGLGYNNDDGTISSRTVTARMETRTLDAVGTPMTAWTLQTSLAITAAQKEPIRRTLKATVAAARYEMRLNVAAAPSTDSKQMDKVIWSGARGYNYTHPAYGNVTLCALKIKASALTAGSGQALSVVGTRWVRGWSGTAWTAEAASRSVVWALLDAYTQICGLPDSTLDLSGLLAMHNKLEAQGHKFDFRFDQSVSLLAAMQTIARAGRCQLCQINGIWSLVRDEAKSTIKAVFTPDNSTGFSSGYQVRGYAEADAVIGEYINPNTGQPKALQYPSGITPARPETVRLAGICERTHAWDETVYLWRSAQRRRYGEFMTGLEGNDLLPQDVVMITADGTGWGSWGHIVSQSGTNTVLSQRLPFTSGRLAVRNPNGALRGIYTIAVQADGVTVTGIPAIALPAAGQEPLYYITRSGATDPQQVRVTKVEPQAGDYVRVSFVVEDAAVYAALPAIPADVTASTTPTALDIPWTRTVGVATSTGYDLRISWGAVAAATGGYAVELQRVGTTGWSQIYAGAATTCTTAVAKGQYNWRVAAVGEIQGAWKTATIEVGAGAALLPVPVVSLASAFDGNALEVTWPKIPNATGYRVSVYQTSPLVLERTRDVTSNNYRYTAEAARDDAAGRALTVRVWAMDAAQNLSAGYGTIAASNAQIPELSGISAAVAGGIAELTYTKPSAADFAGVLVYVSSVDGFTPSSATQFYEGAADRIRIPVTPGTTKYVRLSAYDSWGRDGLVYTAQYTLTATGLGTANIADNAITASKITAGAITADKITTGAITADKITAGAITADKITTGAITADKITAGAITADKLAANSITAGKIASNAVTAATIAAGAVTASKITVASLSAISAAIGTLTTGRLQNATGSALFNLDATGVQEFIRLRNAAGQNVFQVKADGSVYIKGTIEATQLIAGSAIIGSAMIQNAAVTSLSSGTGGAATIPANGAATVATHAYTARGGTAIAFINVAGSTVPGQDRSTEDADMPRRCIISVRVLHNGAAVWTEAKEFNWQQVWGIGTTCILPVFTGAGTLTVQVIAASYGSGSGAVTSTKVAVFQAVK